MVVEEIYIAMETKFPIQSQTNIDTNNGNVRVWVVDDNEDIRQLVSEALSLEKGIRCERLFASPDALLSELASKPGPDVILLDVQMGERNGLDAVRPIKSLTRTTHVMMFTASRNPSWREQALQDGASDYLLKTEPLNRVAERIRYAALNSSPRPHRRRRSSQPETRVLPEPSLSRGQSQTPHLLSRTLKIFRFFSN